MSSPANPFVRDAGIAKPGIIGARWWNHSLRAGSSLHGRRAALTGLAVVAGGVALLGGLTIWAVSKAGGSDDEDGVEEMRKSLQMQRDYGWNFGATSETVAFNEIYTKAYAREALPRLESDLAPKNASYEPYYARALFQSPEALPKLTLPDGDTARVKPLADVLRPVLTPSMEAAALAGAALARTLKLADAAVLVVVDLPGPEAVAFAAGAAESMDPIFAFENWPHPRGVVAAHQTLAAAVYYQPVFARAKDSRAVNAPGMFVLDRARLATYTDSASQFDNRYWAKLPVSLKPLGVGRVLYVVPAATDLPELDDLNGPFVAWQTEGVEVRAVALQAFTAQGDKAAYGVGAAANDASFYGDYAWSKERPASIGHPYNQKAVAYTPTARSSLTVTEASIGATAVVVALGTGVLLGSRLNRSGSWNRSSGGYGG